MRRSIAILAAGATLMGPMAGATTYAADPVLFQGVFPAPLVDAAAMRSPAGARFAAKLHVINNSRDPVVLSAAAALTPELVDARGEATAPSGIVNARPAMRPRGATLAAGQTLTL